MAKSSADHPRSVLLSVVPQDFGKTIDAVSTVSSPLETLGESENLDPKTRAELRGADRQLMRILLFLQVGDRTQQKTEGLRATLQELSDNLLGAEKEAPICRSTSRVSTRICSAGRRFGQRATTARCRRTTSTHSSISPYSPKRRRIAVAIPANGQTSLANSTFDHRTRYAAKHRGLPRLAR